MHHARPESPLLVFVLACVAIVPLAGLLGVSTEKLAARVPVDPEFTRQLLEAGSAFGLLFDLLQDGGIGKHSNQARGRSLTVKDT